MAVGWILLFLLHIMLLFQVFHIVVVTKISEVLFKLAEHLLELGLHERDIPGS